MLLGKLQKSATLKVMKMTEQFHCYECAGKAKAKGESCSTCDGTGKMLPKAKPVTKKLFSRKK